MQLGVEGPLGRHRLRDVAHVKNLTLCYKHFIGNYPVIVCQVCFRQKNYVCLAHSEALRSVRTPRLDLSVRMHMHGRLCEGFLWQSMKCLAGVT